MYALALLMSTAATAAVSGIPAFHLSRETFNLPIPIQPFGVIVAVGLIVGAIPLRRYAEWHGVADEHIRGIMLWIMVTGFLGAHWFDVLAYQWDRIGEVTAVKPANWWPGVLPDGLWPSNWPLGLRIWDGISSYGGFLGGAIGFALYVWWKRLPARLFADLTIIGLLVAFTIGRLGCTTVNDHIGAAVDPNAWYAFLAQDYVRADNLGNLADIYPGTSTYIRAWNLGLLEFFYLVPVNIVVLWLAFRPSKRLPAGFITVLTGVLYAPVRFFLDFLRLEDTDPRYLGLTFAQWASILAFGVAIYAARRILKTGAPAETVAPTSREAQEQLRIILREDDEVQARQAADKQAEAERKKAEIARLRAERDREDAEAEAAERARAAERATAAPASVTQDDDEEDAPGDSDDTTAERAKSAAPASKPASQPGGMKKPSAKPAGSKSSAARNRNKNRKQ
jgi:phosphatidylglycerol---prolipoprotein diacylglyceryl transferase